VNELLLFGSTFVSVMLLVVQSINNNHGRGRLAFLTSFGIGASQLALWKLMPDASATEVAAFLCGGPFGNLAAQWIKRHDIALVRGLRKT